MYIIWTKYLTDRCQRMTNHHSRCRQHRLEVQLFLLQHNISSLLMLSVIGTITGNSYLVFSLVGLVLIYLVTITRKRPFKAYKSLYFFLKWRKNNPSKLINHWFRSKIRKNVLLSLLYIVIKYIENIPLSLKISLFRS